MSIYLHSLPVTLCMLLPLKAVYKLKQMGFEESDVLDALRVCNNNESAAVSSILTIKCLYIIRISPAIYMLSKILKFLRKP